MNNKTLIVKLIPIFNNYPVIKLAYLFGSQVSGKIGPMSDYDLAIYVDEQDKKKIFALKLQLLGEITRVLKTDKVDLVVLNTLTASELKYNIIKEGKLIFVQEPFKVLIEPKILNEYFDFRAMLIRHNLTKS